MLTECFAPTKTNIVPNGSGRSQHPNPTYPQKNDREAWLNPDKRLDDVGLSESQPESGGFHEPPPF